MVKQTCNYIEGYYKRLSKSDHRYTGVVVNPSEFHKRVPKLLAFELLDELQSCRRSRSSHRTVLKFASNCHQTGIELAHSSTKKRVSISLRQTLLSDTTRTTNSQPCAHCFDPLDQSARETSGMYESGTLSEHARIQPLIPSL